LNFSLQFVNQNIELQLQSKLNEISLNDKITYLIRNDELKGKDEPLCPLFFEDVIATQLCKGVKWSRKAYDDNNDDNNNDDDDDDHDSKGEWNDFELKLESIELGKVPQYENMKVMCLYRSLNTTYPVVDSSFNSKSFHSPFES
jgi:hypothetical protein